MKQDQQKRQIIVERSTCQVLDIMARSYPLDTQRNIWMEVASGEVRDLNSWLADGWKIADTSSSVSVSTDTHGNFIRATLTTLILEK